MNENNLLASVAVFSELYNSENYNSISDILTEFIKGAVVYENKYSLNSTELTTLLKKTFEFQIPESVIRTTLSSRFKGIVTKKDGLFHFDPKISKELTTIKLELETANTSHSKINDDLINYIESSENKKLSSDEKAELFENFAHFLLDNGYSDKYSNHISAFIILNEQKYNFTNTLNAIREGMILYQGIKYTADINELGRWNNDLTVYLNTEHLFSALGYNGILFQEIFNDFLRLINEINISSKSTNRRRIELRFFEETKIEVDNYFLTAESIKKGYKQLDPSRSAMKMILDKSQTLSDIKALRVNFDYELKLKGIILQDFNYNISNIVKYNVEDETIIQKLKKESDLAKRGFDQNACRQFFKIFTKINYYRKGDSRKPFEKIGHIFITENNFAKYLAHKNIVKFDEYDTPFAKDIDYIITRFWFKLKKGFSDKQNLPKSFDVVTKAKIILSSHIISSVSKGYQKLVEETKSGKLSKEEAIERSYEFRERPNKPEEISLENLDSSLAFLDSEEFFENFYREKDRKENLLAETEAKNKFLIEQLEAIKNNENAKIQIAKQEEYIKNRNQYVQIGIKLEKRKIWRSLISLMLIFLLNLSLITFATVVAFTSRLKEWFGEWGIYQILIGIFYILIATIEITGRSYIFNKEKIKSGWNSLFFLINAKHKLHEDGIAKILEQEFDTLNTVNEK